MIVNKRISVIINLFSKFHWLDLVVVACLFGFTTLFSLERIQWDYPNVFLGGDAANIVSFALARNHPDWFEKDFLLSEPQNFDIYFQLHVFYTQWLEPITGNATLAFLTLLPPTLLIYLGGLYFFGKIFFGGVGWAIAFVILNTLPISLSIDNIGIQTDPLPRTLFHGCLLFLLGSLWMWKDKPKRWFVLAAGLGGLVYVHAVSMPVWLFAFLLSFAFLLPKEWSIRKRLFWLVGLFSIIFLTVIPFGFNYLQNTVTQRTLPNGVSYTEFMQIFREYYNTPEFHRMPPRILLGILIKLTEIGLLPLGILGAFLAWRVESRYRSQIYLVLIWLIVILVVSVFIPTIEKILEQRLEILPIQTELIRGLRFLSFLLSIMVILGLKVTYELNKKQPFILFLVLLILSLLILRLYNNPTTLALIATPKTIHCLYKEKRILCQRRSTFREVLEFLRDHTPIDAAIFFTPKPRDTSALAVRYLSHRSLVYSWKDRGLGFTRPQKLLEWYDRYSQIAKYKTSTRWLSKNPEQFWEFLKGLGVTYLVVPGKCYSPDQLPNDISVKLIFKNADYSICEIFY